MNSFSCTIIGASHLDKNIVCQDSSDNVVNEKYCAAIVADGHGSLNCPRSDRGSRFACDAAKEAIEEFVANYDIETYVIKDTDHICKQLCKNILLRWHDKVDADFHHNPLSDDELENVSDKYKSRYLNKEQYEHAYGTTLIASFITDDYTIAIRNGDGECVMVDSSGEFSRPIPWNDKCSVNVTTSICDADAIEEFRFYYSLEQPLAIFLGSDGIDDSFNTLPDDLYTFYGMVCRDLVKSGANHAKDELKRALPTLSKIRSRDDMSVAGIVNEELISSIVPILDDMDRTREEQARKEEEVHAALVLETRIKELHRDLQRLQKKKEDLRSSANQNALAFLEFSKKKERLNQKIEEIEDERVLIEKSLLDLEEERKRISDEIASREKEAGDTAARGADPSEEPLSCDDDTTQNENVNESTKDFDVEAVNIEEEPACIEDAYLSLNEQDDEPCEGITFEEKSDVH